MAIKPIEYRDGVCRMIDQRLLPTEEVWRDYFDYQGVAEAIRTMVVRGAPAIGVAAAFGAWFGARDIEAEDFDGFFAQFEKICATLAATRPTAVNLCWALERMKNFARASSSYPVADIKIALEYEAMAIADEDIRVNMAMGRHGQELIPDGARVLTHCNAGALATGGFGTALGVLRAARAAGKNIAVLADETRPFLQGARLTAWELEQYGIPYDIITDGSAGLMMRKGLVQKVFFGADRVAANGDVANKIGSYMLALAAYDNGIPAYSVFPISTVDLELDRGDLIPIEERAPEEVLALNLMGRRVTPEKASARNFAFDVTPNRLFSGWVTEKGVIKPPFKENLLAALEAEGAL